MAATFHEGLVFHYIPSPKEFGRAMSNYDETYDETYDEIIETYDEIVVKTASKCFARMKGCWDPKVEPSVEEIVDYPMISLWRFSQFAFSSELVFRAGGVSLFSRAHGG